MTEKEKNFLSDVLRSIGLIESFTENINSFSEYQADLKTKGAVERHLGIIGEAVNKFLKISKTNKLENASQIISLRNRVIHANDTIDDSIIWTVKTRYLCLLKNEILKKFDEDK